MHRLSYPIVWLQNMTSCIFKGKSPKQAATQLSIVPWTCLMCRTLAWLIAFAVNTQVASNFGTYNDIHEQLTS
ncbi:hypothetical protein T06_5526 [Trichinella sp. T6]|nr:hypothetical protein T06_5526 [Trichinella sp. T6]